MTTKATKLDLAQNAEDKLDSALYSPLCCSTRLLLACVCFVGFALNYAQRIGMSVAIVCMVNQTAVRLLATNGSTQSYEHETGTKDGPFVWHKEAQGHILGGFFYGYLVSQIPAGLLAERFGGKWLFLITMCVTAVSTLLSPLAAREGYVWMICLRVATGIGSGGIYPIMHTIWGRWAPPLERSKLAGISYAGAVMGNVLYLPTAGVLCAVGGWPYIFYLVGVLTLMWCVIWIVFVSDDPMTSRRISEKERRYITTNLKGQSSSEHGYRGSIPWLRVVRSPAVWAVIVANVTSDWGLYTLLTNIPTYMNDVLHFDIKSNGFLSALPFLGLWANMTISSILADYLRAQNILSTTSTRKVFNFVGQAGAAILLVALGYVGAGQRGVAVAILVLATAISGSAYSGFLVNHIDIAPPYAGTLLGIANSIAACTGFVAPYVAAVLTKNHNQAEWRIVFFIAAAFYLFGAIVFALCGSGELQSWGVPRGALEEQGLRTPEKDPEINANGLPNQKTDDSHTPALNNGSVIMDKLL